MTNGGGSFRSIQRHDGLIVTVGVPDIVVVGAGPTGLALALQAHSHGAGVRVLEQRMVPARPSRAMIVHPRTLEVLRPLGVTEEILAAGLPRARIDLHLSGRVVGATLGDFALSDTPYPFLVLIRQSALEAILLRDVRRRGIDVEFGRTVRGYRIEEGYPVSVVETAAGVTELTSRFLVGCDGGASLVRQSAGISFDGGRYPVDIVLADLELGGRHGASPDVRVGHAALTPSGLVMLLPLGDDATWRLLATVPATPDDSLADPFGPPVPVKALAGVLQDARLPFDITSVAWSSRVAVHHRLAFRYRRGPVLLAGDAAHRFSPAGGQGMNTGIQDACALGWRLAMAARSPGRTDPLLDSYETERRRVARADLALTHMLFWLEAGLGPGARAARWAVARVAGRALPLLLQRDRLVASVIGTLAQLRWAYSDSPLSLDARPRFSIGTHRGEAPGRPGQRLSDADVTVDGVRGRLHDLIATPGVHLLLARSAVLPADIPGRRITVSVHRIETWTGDEALGVRPDGHIGFRGPASRCGSWLRLLEEPTVAPNRA